MSLVVFLGLILCALSAFYYAYRPSRKTWFFLKNKPFFFQKKDKTAFLNKTESLLKDRSINPMSAEHLNSACKDLFKGVEDRDLSREPSSAFTHLESVLGRIQSRFLSHQTLGSKGLLGDTLIDQKAFMDCFRSEKDVIVALYHCNEQKLIFVSSNVKKLLGYGPSDFRTRFHDILHDVDHWFETLQLLRSRHKIYAPLALYRVSEGVNGSLCAWDAYLGYLQRGQAQYAAILLYPAFCQLKP